MARVRADAAAARRAHRGHGPRLRHRRGHERVRARHLASAVCPPCPRRCSPASTTPLWATSTAARRSRPACATAAPPWRCRSPSGRTARAACSSTSPATPRSSSTSRPPSSGRWPCSAAPSTSCSPTPPTRRRGRLVPGHPHRRAAAARGDGPGAPPLPAHPRAALRPAGRRPCRCGRTPLGSPPRPTSRSAATSSATCAAGAVPATTSGRCSPRPSRPAGWRRQVGDDEGVRLPGRLGRRVRVHRLEIEAFGPFADRVVVDVDALSAEGLFLIHGPTGSGKTSLLDADLLRPLRRRARLALQARAAQRPRRAGCRAPRHARAHRRHPAVPDHPLARVPAPQEARHRCGVGAGRGDPRGAPRRPVGGPEHPPRRGRRRRQGRPRHGDGAVRQGGAAPPGRLRRLPAGHARGPPRGARAALRHLRVQRRRGLAGRGAAHRRGRPRGGPLGTGERCSPASRTCWPTRTTRRASRSSPSEVPPESARHPPARRRRPARRPGEHDDGRLRRGIRGRAGGGGGAGRRARPRRPAHPRHACRRTAGGARGRPAEPRRAGGGPRRSRAGRRPGRPPHRPGPGDRRRGHLPSPGRAHPRRPPRRPARRAARR